MVSLISVWKLKHQAPVELESVLRALADQVKESEPDTLVYSVHLAVPDPRSATKSSVGKGIAEVVFFEVYKDLAAFDHHLKGAVFTSFLARNLKYFIEDPERSGHPLTTTTFLQRESAFFRA